MATFNGGDHFALALSCYAAGATAAEFSLGDGDCWGRAEATVKALHWLSLTYVKGHLHSPVGMEPDGHGPHGFCLLGDDGEQVIVDPVIGDAFIQGLVTLTSDQLVWEVNVHPTGQAKRLRRSRLR